ncbi:MAG: hypothetical protein K0U20_07885 [Proteobacteria bacterium]|nr:hypothetical protein [Pseudomonadota bacterium]
MNLQEKFESRVSQPLIDCFGINKYGYYWYDYGLNPDYEKKIDEGKIVRPLTEDEKMTAMILLKDTYFALLEMCKDLGRNETKFSSKVFKTAVSMSEECHHYKNAYNIAVVAVDTAHNRSWFREAINRNKNKDNITGNELLKINLEKIVEYI